MRRPRAGMLVAGVIALACRRSSSDCPGGARVELVAPRAPVGFDADVAIVARPLCAEAREGTIEWRQLAGAAALAPSDGGWALQLHTPTLAASFGAPLPWGIVPLSPRTRGEVTLEATWSDGHGATERHALTVEAAARARGLPNMAVGARVFLGGAGWRLDARPPASAATLEGAGGVASLLPDVAGDWRLVDAAGNALTVRSARYDETPLDCGRSGCHAAIAAACARSPMTTVLARGLAPRADGHGAAFGDAYPACALACHATGEPGVHDGGFVDVFVDVMGDLGLTALDARSWDRVPRALRRLGGVGCLACHGPGALPEVSARWSVLRADVCAACHDAPPRYGHVAAWRTTAMAHADRDARAAREPACARCHTTAGFLARDAGAVANVDRRPPPEVGPMGITCAACHAVHAKVSGAPPQALLRALPRPLLLAGVSLPETSTKSGVCLGCHTPALDEAAPAASAAALWLGRGGLDPRTGAALSGPAPHASVTGGCVGCHAAGPTGLERGAGHAFVAGMTACASCHPKTLPAEDLRARAQSLWATWRARTGGVDADARPPHARDVPLDRATTLGRAAWDLSLVLEDPAAAAHNAPYARLLLAAAEKALNAAGPPVGRGVPP